MPSPRRKRRWPGCNRMACGQGRCCSGVPSRCDRPARHRDCDQPHRRGDGPHGNGKLHARMVRDSRRSSRVVLNNALWPPRSADVDGADRDAVARRSAHRVKPGGRLRCSIRPAPDPARHRADAGGACVVGTWLPGVAGVATHAGPGGERLPRPLGDHLQPATEGGDGGNGFGRVLRSAATDPGRSAVAGAGPGDRLRHHRQRRDPVRQHADAADRGGAAGRGGEHAGRRGPDARPGHRRCQPDLDHCGAQHRWRSRRRD